MNETGRVVFENSLKIEKKVSKLGLTLKAVLAIFLIDRWIFGPVRTAVARKGPLFSFHRHGLTRRRKAKAKGFVMKIFGYTLGAIAGISIIAILAVKLFAFGEKKVTEATSKTAAV